MIILYDDNTGLPLDTLFTDANGMYLFEDIPSGDYYIIFDPSTSTTAGAADFPFTQMGGDSEADQNGQGPSFSFDATMGDDLTHDAGLVPAANIGDFVWADTDGDGIQDPSENGVANVEVVLFDNTTGLPLDTVYTDSNGAYTFENVPAGDYYIEFDPTGSGLGNTEFTASNSGNGTNDSEANANGQTPSFLFDPFNGCLLYTSPSPRDGLLSRMPSSA